MYLSGFGLVCRRPYCQNILHQADARSGPHTNREGQKNMTRTPIHKKKIYYRISYYPNTIVSKIAPILRNGPRASLSIDIDIDRRWSRRLTHPHASKRPKRRRTHYSTAGHTVRRTASLPPCRRPSPPPPPPPPRRRRLRGRCRRWWKTWNGKSGTRRRPRCRSRITASPVPSQA